ncbi:MAG: hypothetical protein AAFX03_03920 [Pseudomonadota bacterium]
MADSPRLEMISARLRAAGLRPSRADVEAGFDAPLVVDARSADAADVRAVRKHLASGRGGVPIAVLGPLSGVQADILLKTDADIAALPARLGALRRARLRDEEWEMRRANAAYFGDAETSAQPLPRSAVLLIGGGSTLTLGLLNALTAQDLDVVGAYAPRTAASYLADQDFHAIVLDAMDDTARAILDQMASAGWLGRCPIIACAHSGGRIPDHVTDILDATDPAERLAEAIASLAWRSAAARRDVADPRIADGSSGVYAKPFFLRHLDDQMRRAARSEEPITVAVFKAHSGPDAPRAALALAKALPPHLRQTDCLARLDWTTLAASFRDTPFRGAAALTRRALSETGFSDCVSVRILERRAYHADAEDLLRAAQAGPAKWTRRRA